MNELLCNAGAGLTPLRIPGEEAPRRADVPDYSEELEQRLELEDALRHITISAHTQAECREELRRGELRGWKR